MLAPIVSIVAPSTNVSSKAPSSMVTSAEVGSVATNFTPVLPVVLNVIPLNAPFLIVTFAAKAGKTISIKAVASLIAPAPAKAYSPISKGAVFAGSFIALPVVAFIPVKPLKAFAPMLVSSVAALKFTILIASLSVGSCFASTSPAISVTLPKVAVATVVAPANFGTTIPVAASILLTATSWHNELAVNVEVGVRCSYT
ncbi:hypothetical protein Barb6XT_00587 [Bacteroidales bacterium Barb6XT]|nr:hypothetical protein Barb6XT_00587 [Bacteroidales bacterium Barb6XT]